jgi:glycosyltransferase involved in cell wall biosynthesis
LGFEPCALTVRCVKFLRIKKVKPENTIKSSPLFSVIIAVYDDWTVLEGCLHALSLQRENSQFEVLLVDDGSAEPAPESVLRWRESFPVTLLRQEHAGISLARNKGIQASHGAVLVFVDADCRMFADCLAALEAKLTASPQQTCFQLHLVGDRANVVGRAEDLRLIALQSHLLLPDGHIRYLNTAGFAIRRSKVSEDGNLFSPIAIRAEDTLLLATLMRRGELPVFVPDATVRHAIPLSLLECLSKDVHSAYVERRAYDVIASRGITIQLTNADRWAIMANMWKASAQDSIGRFSWFVVTGRQVLRLVISAVYRILH